MDLALSHVGGLAPPVMRLLTTQARFRQSNNFNAQLPTPLPQHQRASQRKEPFT
jgi:hypothetical protein